MRTKSLPDLIIETNSFLKFLSTQYLKYLIVSQPLKARHSFDPSRLAFLMPTKLFPLGSNLNLVTTQVDLSRPPVLVPHHQLNISVPVGATARLSCTVSTPSPPSPPLPLTP